MSRVARVPGLAVTILIAATTSTLVAHEVTSSPREQVEDRVLELMEQHQVPGVSVAVFEDGEIEWAKGFGVLEHGTDRAVTASTHFQAASISKPVAAVAALRLVETGDLELDDDVNEFLLEWQVPDEGFTEAVTLRRLLCHGAGVTVHGFPGYDSRGKVADLLDILDGRAPANTAAILVDLEPGEQFRYSGGGYCVLQQMMIDVTERPFPELLAELVLKPIGMTHSTYAQPLPPELHQVAAHGHGPGMKPMPGRWNVYPEMAAAGLWTTARDLARFAIAVNRAANPESEGILSTELAQEMLSPQVAPANGLGVFLRNGGALFEHSGGNMGFRCRMFCLRETTAGAVIMTNSDSGGQLVQELVKYLDQAYGWSGGN